MCTDNRDVQRLYESLLEGSENHLRAFVKTIEPRLGEGAYQAQVIEADQLEDILDRERFSLPIVLRLSGAPGEIRTPDQLVRSQLLYPAELRALGFTQSGVLYYTPVESVPSRSINQPKIVYSGSLEARRSGRLVLQDGIQPVHHI